MDESGKSERISNVYRVDRDLSVHKIISGVACANSTCFSPDGRVMYFADTPTGEIWAYDYDTNTGDISNKKVFANFSDQPGTPDGSIVDSEGYLWNAQWNGHRVVRYRPDSTVDRVISIPVMNPTCLAFGGKALDVIYVTTARYLMTPEQIKAEPLSGGLFAVMVDVKGLNEPKFGG
jgi:L-arabinonolactonase